VGDEIGHLTSGTLSPTLNEGIGLGYVGIDHTDPGISVGIVVRGSEKRAEITALPFRST